MTRRRFTLGLLAGLIFATSVLPLGRDAHARHKKGARIRVHRFRGKRTALIIHRFGDPQTATKRKGIGRHLKRKKISRRHRFGGARTVRVHSISGT